MWIEGQTAQPQLPSSSRDQFGDAFGSAAPAQQQRPRRTCLRSRAPVSIWRNSTPSIATRNCCGSLRCSATPKGNLLPPLPSDVVVAGSRQHLAFSDAQISVEAVRAETLLDEGYQNDFLMSLHRHGSRRSQSRRPTPSEQEIAKQAATEMAKEKPYDQHGRSRGGNWKRNATPGRPEGFAVSAFVDTFQTQRQRRLSPARSHR